MTIWDRLAAEPDALEVIQHVLQVHHDDYEDKNCGWNLRIGQLLSMIRGFRENDFRGQPPAREKEDGSGNTGEARAADQGRAGR